MSDGVQLGLAILGALLIGFAVFKAFRVLGRRRKSGAKNNWTNEAYLNRNSFNTWEKDG